MIRIALASQTDIAGWREAARKLLLAGVLPARVEFNVGSETLFDEGDPITPPGDRKPVISKELLNEIQTGLLHSDPERFALAYRIVFRAQTQPKILQNPADPDMHSMRALAKSVRRDIHKMHAFVRFRKVGEADGRESFVAWFEPEHHITEAVAKFFQNRFTGMNWLIVTPEASIAWDGKKLEVGPGGQKSDVPQEDAVESEWKTYYASIFNPARLKTKAMMAEMPAKYWKNLPEAALIPGLTREAETRMQAMIDNADAPAIAVKEAQAPAHANGGFTGLKPLYEALRAADDWPRDRFSERLVAGEGPEDAALMFVGEQPGDQEDLAGRPFVGPAGQLLDRAFAAASIDRSEAYVTNAVKRFKYIERGKRRIHSKPSNDDIEYYRWWLEQERQVVEPKVIVALGATAVRALTGKTLTISRNRSQLIDYIGSSKLLITVHPSYLLRLPDGAGQKVEFEKLVRDLECAHDALSA